MSGKIGEASIFAPPPGTGAHAETALEGALEVGRIGPAHAFSDRVERQSGFPNEAFGESQALLGEPGAHGGTCRPPETLVNR